MRKLLLLGGAGFIGSNIIRKLQHGDYEIHVCEPVGAYMQRLNGLEAQVHHALLSDIESISKIIQDNDPKCNPWSSIINHSCFYEYWE